jgi:phosphoglycolate phosphatase
MSSITLACLDMAGTTLNDDGAVEAAFHAAMGELGVVEGTDRFATMLDYVRDTMGQSKIEVFTHLFEGDLEAAHRANDAFEAAYAKSVESGRVTPIAGALDTIGWLRSQGIKVCLTTGFSPATRTTILDAVGWHDLADLVLSPADCGRGRPYPDMILCAVIKLEIDAVAQVVVVGDTANDLWSGVRSGARIVVGVLTGAHDKDALSAVPGTHIIDSIADLPTLIANA